MFRVSLLLALLLVGPPTQALESDKEQPIELVADSVDIDETKGVSIYKGDVDLRQGSMHLRADIVTVYQVDRKTTKVVVQGRGPSRRCGRRASDPLFPAVHFLGGLDVGCQFLPLSHNRKQEILGKGQIVAD